MIVPQAEIDLVLNPQIRRRMMRLPVISGVSGERKRCPVREGCSYQLQPRAGAKGQATITIIEVRREKLATITLADARREGYAGIQGALHAWTRTNHTPRHNENVWVIAFAKDKDRDCAEFLNQDLPLYLAKHGDYTTQQDRAIQGEAEVLMPFKDDLEAARAKATEQRASPQQQALIRMAADTETLLESLTAMKSRNRAKLIQKEIEKLSAQLSAAMPATLPASVCAECQAFVDAQDDSRPNSTQSDVSLESAA